MYDITEHPFKSNNPDLLDKNFFGFITIGVGSVFVRQTNMKTFSLSRSKAFQFYLVQEKYLVIKLIRTISM